MSFTKRPRRQHHLNSNNDKTYKVTPESNRRESLQTTQIAFLIRNAFWVSGGGEGRRRGTKNIRARVTAKGKW